MLSSLTRRVITVLRTQSLFSSFVFAQQGSSEGSRPRRVESEWPVAKSSPSVIPTPTISSLGRPEPKIRVALNTNARSAVISTTARLMNASGGGNTLVALDTSRVRVEPHMLSPIPQQATEELYRVIVAGATTRDEAEQTEKEIKKITGEDPQVTLDTETKTWGVLISFKPREEAEQISETLEAAGYDATVLGPSSRQNEKIGERTSDTSVRLASRISLPSREVVGASATNGHLFSSSAPVSLASDDEKDAPVLYNDRPYRGRIEVFTNLRGSLTVVNELGLEDYVRGGVANELSPGGYPAIEALKAQAIAARTYALKNRGQFMAEGFDILPTTRSQVYRGLTSENPLSTRAVDETRGLIATYAGEPINALYTSTCGGRTEDSESIFNQPVPYLRSRECAAEGLSALSPFTIKTNREPAELHTDSYVPLARDVSLLVIQNVNTFPSRVSDAWFAADASVAEVKNLLANAARIAHQPTPAFTDDINRPPAFASALAAAVLGDSRSSTLLNEADADYLLAVRDANDVPLPNRADLAMLVRDGHLFIYPDATIRPRTPLSDSSRVETSFNFKEEMHGQPATDNLCCARRAAGINRSELIQKRSCFARLAMRLMESGLWRWWVVKPSPFI